MRRRRSPRGIGEALDVLTTRVAPLSLLGDVQRVWPEVAGPAMSSRAQPTAARNGVVTLSCESAVWAQELTLMAPELVLRLNAVLGDDRVVEVRCGARASPSWARASRS